MPLPNIKNSAVAQLLSFPLNTLKFFSLSIDRTVKGEKDFDRAKLIIPFFYYFLFFIAFTKIEGLNYIIGRGGIGFRPRWPIFWAEGLNYGTVVSIIFIGFTIASLFAAFMPFSRTARISAFISVLSYHSYMSSFGGPIHQWDILLWTSFILIFLPDIKNDRQLDVRRRFSMVVWTVQAFVLLTYSMSGIGKITYGLAQLYRGETNAFSMDACAIHTATLLQSMRETTILGPTIIAHPAICWGPFLAVLYLQVFSIIIVFYPAVHRVWGLFLILFHIGTFLTMRAVFTAPSAIIATFFLSSPFATKNYSLAEIIQSLPLFGRIVNILYSGRKTGKDPAK